MIVALWGEEAEVKIAMVNILISLSNCSSNPNSNTIFSSSNNRANNPRCKLIKLSK